MISLATPDDVPQIYALCTASYKENQGEATTLTIDFEKSLLNIGACITNGHCWVARNDADPKYINGLVMIAPNQAWFSKDFFFTGLMCYIKPEFRTFKLVKSLLSPAKNCAIMGRVPLAFDIFTQKDAYKKIKLFKYLGFEEWGSSLLFVPST